MAIVGYPNAGKSQLLNALVGEKLAAVSRKRHTTRDGIMGVLSREDTQIVFCDTPGFMTDVGKDSISYDLSMSAKSYMAGVDYSLVVIDAAKTKLTPDYMNTISQLMWNALFAQGEGTPYSAGGKEKSKFGIVLNKVDLVKPKSKLLDVAKTFGKMADQMILERQKLLHHNSAQQQQQDQQQDQQVLQIIPSEDILPEIFYTSAKQGQNDVGVQDVLSHLLDMSIEDREWLLPEAHMLTPMDYKARVEEIIREKIYRRLHREVPHQIRQHNRQLELIRGDGGEDKTDGDDASDNEDNKNTNDLSSLGHNKTKGTSTSSTKNNNVILIHQDLLVRSKSHLNLLQKNSGMNLQQIHDAAVPELRLLFQCEVFLTLSAKLVSRNRR